MIAAPLGGLSVDWARTHPVGENNTGSEFWPIGVLGGLIALGFFAGRGEEKRECTRRNRFNPGDLKSPTIRIAGLV